MIGWKVLIGLLVCLLISVTSKAKGNLTVVFYQIYGNRVEIEWYASEDTSAALTNCQFIYSPMDHPKQIHILSNISPGRSTLELEDLSDNASYHFHVKCYDEQHEIYISNNSVFTTGSKSKMDNQFLSSRTQDGSLNIMNGLRPFPVALKNERRIPSSNVILGATCGIVGFIIINITIVMIVRRYSYWRMTQRRMVALQDYEEYPYM